MRIVAGTNERDPTNWHELNNSLILKVANFYFLLLRESVHTHAPKVKSIHNSEILKVVLCVNVFIYAVHRNHKKSPVDSDPPLTKKPML